METYRVNDIAPLFQVQGNTIRQWSEEFTSYLSDDANPQKGEVRLFSDNDLKVISLVAQMRNKRKTFDDIHASLAAGTRGEIPKSSSDIVPIRNPLTLRVQELVEESNAQQIKIAKLETEIRILREQLDKTDNVDHKEELANLNQQIGKLQGKLESLEGKD